MEQLLCAKEIIQEFNISRSKFYELCNIGEIPHYQIGHNKRFKRSEIDKYLEQNKKGKGAD